MTERIIQPGPLQTSPFHVTQDMVVAEANRCSGAVRDREAFKVIEPSGKTYRVYANGEIEGFSRGSTIVNRIPVLISEAIHATPSGGPVPVQ